MSHQNLRIYKHYKQVTWHTSKIPFHLMPSCSSCPIEQHLWPLILHPHSMPSQPLSLVPEAATLQLSSMDILLCTPVVLWAERIAQIFLTQIPPHAHLSLKASHHASCKPKQQASGQHGRKTSLYILAGAPGAKAACRDWDFFLWLLPLRPQSSREDHAQLIPRGSWRSWTLIRPKHLSAKAAASVQPKIFDRNITVKCWIHPWQAWAVALYAANLNRFA